MRLKEGDRVRFRHGVFHPYDPRQWWIGEVVRVGGSLALMDDLSKLAVCMVEVQWDDVAETRALVISGELEKVW